MTLRHHSLPGVISRAAADVGGVRPRRKHATFLFLLLFSVYALTLGEEPSLDADAGHFAAWHLVDAGNPWIEETDYLQGHPLRHVWVTGNGEHEVVSRAPGVIAGSVPAYAFGQLDEFSNIPGGLSAALLSALGMTFFYLGLSTRCSSRASLLGVLVLGLGTPVWAVAADAMWPHTLTVFAAGGMVWSAATGRWWLVGLFGGVGLWGRSHFALVAATLGLGVAIARRKPAVAVMVGLPAISLLLLMVLWTKWFYGAWRLTGSYQFGSVGELSERYPSLLTNELGLFVSLERGILVWTPVLILLAPTLVRGWRTIDDWAKALAIGGFIYTLAQGYAQVFHGGDSYWGYRLGLELVACLLPAYVMTYSGAGRLARAWVAPVVAGQVIAMGLGAVAEAGGASAEDAWWRNSLAVVFAASPLIGVVFVVLVAACGVLVHRLLGPVLRTENE